MCGWPAAGQELGVERIGGAWVEATAGEPLSLVFRIQNRSTRPHAVAGETVVPEGWELIVRPTPISLGPEESKTSILSLSVPAAAKAGEYELTYTAKAPSGEASGTASLTISVRDRRALHVGIVEQPEFVAAGEASIIRFRISNGGNRDARVVLDVTADGELEASVEYSEILIEAGESVVVPVSITTSERGSGIVTLTAMLGTDASVRARSAAALQVIQRGNQRSGYHHMPLKLQLRLPGEGANVRPQTVLSAAGPIFDKGSERLDLYVRTPSQRSIGIFGKADLYRAAYYSDKYDVLVGDHVYRTSPLTTSGGSFFGAMTSARFGDTEVGALVNRSRWQFYDQAQQGVFVKYGDPEASHTSYQVLNRAGVDAGQIVSVQGILRDYPMLHVDAEAGLGQMEAQKSAAWQIRFSGTSEDVKYAIQHEKIGLDFPSPLRGRLANTARVAWDVSDRVEVYGRYMFSEKDYPGSDEIETSFFRSRGRAGGRYRTVLGELRLRLGAGLERTVQQAVTAAEASRSVSDALRLEGTAGFRAFGFNATALLGRLDDDWIGEIQSFRDVTVQASYQPSAEHGYNAFVHYYDGARMHTLADFRLVSVNFSGFYRPDRRWMVRLRSSLGLNKIGYWQRGYVLRGDVEHRLPNGHEVEVSVLGQRFMGAGLGRALFMLAYAIPLELPVTRSRVGGRLIGSVVDANRRGVENVRVFLGDRVALTDGHGRFEFAGLESGAYRLALSRGDLGLDVVPVEALPKMIQIVAPERRSVQIGVTAAAELSGTVDLLAYRTERRLSADRELISQGGLRNVVVELVRDSVRYRQVTNRLGEFTFGGLAPGEWTLRVVPSTVPSQHEARLQASSFQLNAGQHRHVKIDVVPRVRRIRFIQPVESSEPLQPPTPPEGAAQVHPTESKLERLEE